MQYFKYKKEKMYVLEYIDYINCFLVYFFLDLKKLEIAYR